MASTRISTQFRTPQRASGRAVQTGTTAVEFAIVAIFYFTLVFGLVDFGRWLFAMNTANEATRWGTRIAVVCDIGDSAIKDRMRSLMPMISADSNINVTYTPAGCSASSCTAVTVELTGVTLETLTPFIAWITPTMPVPPTRTTLPRESLLSSIDGSANPVCS